MLDNTEQFISAKQFADTTVANLGSEVFEKLQNSVVAVAGLGGLGSVVCQSLARAGVGKLIIADFDKVEASNLNRQLYFVHQLGKSKTEAMIENLKKINPYIEIDSHDLKLTHENIATLFGSADIIAECFDKPEAKQMIVETVLAKMPSKTIVSASGLAGYGDSNSITTKKINDRLIMVGDFETGIKPGLGLYAARVGIAANHQANAILELLLQSVE